MGKRPALLRRDEFPRRQSNFTCSLLHTATGDAEARSMTTRTKRVSSFFFFFFHYALFAVIALRARISHFALWPLSACSVG